MNEKTNNMFGGFFFGLLGVYLFYYVGMIGYDLYVADKMGETENVSKEIDIAAAASSYVPKDVRTLFAEDKPKPGNESPSEDEASNNLKELAHLTMENVLKEKDLGVGYEFDIYDTDPSEATELFSI